MLAAVVIAHPCPDSFTHELARRACAGVVAGGNDVTVIDLYAVNFVAAMTAAERTAYHAETPILDPIVAEHAALVTTIDALIVIYPTWWSGLPAILKGWFERVMVPGVGFRFDDRTGKVKPGLGNIRHLIGVSTYGSTRTAVRAINDNGRRTITRALRLSCGRGVRARWYGLYGIDTSTVAQRTEFASAVERAMADLR